MRKQMTEYRKWLRSLLDADAPGTDWEKLAEEHLVKLAFYRHERLIHLIVTVTFALLEMICAAVLFIRPGIGAIALALTILVLLVPYIGHYYFLENTVQEFYLMYDEIRSRCRDAGRQRELPGGFS